jgi:hypothetical protein
MQPVTSFACWREQGDEPAHLSRFSDNVADMLLDVMYHLLEDGFIETDANDVWVTTKKWRAEVIMHELREDNGTNV